MTRILGSAEVAPTAAIDSGQMSRISSRKGTRCSREAMTPAQPQKNWGEVAMITSGACASSEASDALSM